MLISLRLIWLTESESTRFSFFFFSSIFFFSFSGTADITNGGTPLFTIPPQATWKSILEVWKSALEHEKGVSQRIYNLVKLSKDQNDC